MDGQIVQMDTRLTQLKAAGQDQCRPGRLPKSAQIALLQIDGRGV